MERLWLPLIELARRGGGQRVEGALGEPEDDVAREAHARVGLHGGGDLSHTLRAILNRTRENLKAHGAWRRHQDGNCYK